MRLLLVLGLIALASASPLVDKKGSSMKVIDIPADLFAEASDNVEEVKKPEEIAAVAAASVPENPDAKVEEAEAAPVEEIAPVPVAVDDKKDVATSLADKDDKKTDVSDVDDEKPNVFGFRIPTIIILRRPAVFDDPFSFFPSFSFNRRPLFGGGMPMPADDRDIHDGDEGLVDQRPVSSSAVASEQRPVSVGGRPVFSDIMHNMRQQMDSLFSGLFAPNPGYFPNPTPNRQFFPRPFFPPVPTDESEDSFDLDKLPDNYKNSTSETKVVDGQVVQVNKTVHKIGGNNSNGFFSFSVINIRPSESPIADEIKPEDAAGSVPPAAVAVPEELKPESEATTIKAQQEKEMSNPSLNEVDQEQEKEMPKTKYETDAGLLEQPSEPTAPKPLSLTQEVVYDFVPLKSMPLIEGTKGNDGKKLPHDLSSDLRVNNLMANNENERFKSLVDPDEIEVIEV